MAFAIFLFTGLMLGSDGVDVATGTTLDDSVTPVLTTTIYTTYTTSTNWIVSAFANSFFYGAFVLIVASTYFAIRAD